MNPRSLRAQVHLSEFDTETISDGLISRHHEVVNLIRRRSRHILNVTNESGDVIIIFDDEPRVGEHTVENVLLNVLEDVLLVHEERFVFPHSMRSRGHRLVFVREEIAVLEVNFFEVVELDVVQSHIRQLDTIRTTESDIIRITIPRTLEQDILDDDVTLVILCNCSIEIHDMLYLIPFTMWVNSSTHATTAYPIGQTTARIKTHT